MLQKTIDDSVPAGLLHRALRGLFMRTAQVVEVQALSPQFRLITLAGDALEGVNWVPGEKIQLAMHGFATRTYTPMCWDAQEGVTRLLGYAHGAAPGAQWLMTAKVGDTCQFLGPRRSIPLDQLSRPALVFGDETSFALAYALRYAPGGAAGSQPKGTPGASFLFEVNSRSESQQVIDALDIDDAVLIQRQPGDAHWAHVEAQVSDYFDGSSMQHHVLTGKSTSIQRVLGILRRRNVPRQRLTTKAYWAPGKAGLD